MMRRFVLSSVVALASALLKMPARDQYPQVIAHRGASGYIPEHSIAAYQLAIDLGTDYIEPDLCVSKDGVFIAMHDLLLDDTTNVASLPQFNDKKTTKFVEGSNMTGYFVSDFLYSELQELRLNQRLAGRTTLYNGLFQIPSFDQIMSLAQTSFSNTGRMVGIYPELKHPSYHHSLGYDMEQMLLDSLQQGGYETSGDAVPNNLHQVVPVVIQCFEPESLKILHEKTSIPLVLLLEPTPDAFWSLENMQSIASFAQAIGPEKTYFGNGRYEVVTESLANIRAAGLSIHPWTMRADRDISSKFKNNFAQEEMYFYCCLGIDGVFSEFPDRTRETINVMNNYTAAHVAMKSDAPVCNMNCHIWFSEAKTNGGVILSFIIALIARFLTLGLQLEFLLSMLLLNGYTNLQQVLPAMNYSVKYSEDGVMGDKMSSAVVKKSKVEHH